MSKIDDSSSFLLETLFLSYLRDSVMLGRIKLTSTEIGYYGKPINELNREELLEAFLELSQTVYDSAAGKNNLKIFYTETDK